MRHAASYFSRQPGSRQKITITTGHHRKKATIMITGKSWIVVRGKKHLVNGITFIHDRPPPLYRKLVFYLGSDFCF